MVDEKYRKYIFFIYFILLIFIAFGLNNLFADSRDVGYISTNPISHDLKLVWYSFITFCFGAFYGITIIVAWFDWTKRRQTILILVSSIIVIGAYMHIVTLRPLIFFIGLLTGAYLSHMTKTEKENYVEYKVSTIIIAVIASIIVWLTLLNYILGNSKTDTSVLYFLLASAFSLVFYKFATYPEINCKLFILGPPQSGKTVFIGALYEKAYKLKRLIGVPSDYLLSIYKSLFDSKWLPANIDDKPCDFSYLHGHLFSKKIKIDLDYSGERILLNIDDIIDLINKKVNKKDNPNIQPKNIIEKIADGIYNADRLIFLIDPKRIGISEKIANRPMHYIKDCYLRIRKEIPDKPYYLVITKSDTLFDGRKLSEENYDQFREDAIIFMNQKEPFFGNMEHAADAVIPVCFCVTDKKPEIKDNKFNTFGFDKVLEIVGR